MERNLSLCIVLALLVPFSTLSLVNAEVTDISTDKQALLALKARTLPPQLGNLSFLATLVIKNNSFYGSLPEDLAHLHRLKYLSFGVIPKEIRILTQLKRLLLNNNKLQGEIPKELGSLSELEILSLANNSLMGTIPSLIFNLSSLISMDFSNNSLSGSLSDNMCQHLPNLEEFYMSYNQLTGPIPHSLGQCRMLDSVMLSNNQFGERIPREIGNLTLIKNLYLKHGREGKVSREGDVYSYGIMLMETFTRKKPTDEIFTEDMSLRSWVGESLCSTLMQVLDTNLLRRDDEHFSTKEECVSSILSLAMECTRESPAERMSIKEVATRLIKIRVEFAKIGIRRGRRREMDELAANCP
ncbi:hypothetical protein Pint_11716 [Pistacia integerrima]|uniref:Uncharacterized protein n=1 Tax=Pistacia integerrima TaxID=434235 RepID=A0ACC0XEX1_9ROSI|nr:hypothetical protein Pint_11716 [Pistacia integerrima]